MRPWYQALALLCLLPAGCASTQPAGASRDYYADVPEHFSIDVTILAAEDEPEAHRRTARYVVFPDGSLHHDARPGVGPNTLPPLSRQLSKAQMADLWAKARELGLVDASKADQVENFRRVVHPSSGHAYLVAFSADGEYWNFTRGVPEGERLDPALTELLRELAMLAWAEDGDDRRRAEPVRYDFGPDPWAAYRGGQEQ
ncbi:MAG: hypothetical protein CMJ36_04355 [Phycisphaerae bacterium]|nr:hypothetical protein [Phycisphaerae bacterium]